MMMFTIGTIQRIFATVGVAALLISVSPAWANGSRSCLYDRLDIDLSRLERQPSALDSLREFLKRGPKGMHARHVIEERNGRTVLRVGIVFRDESEFLRLLVRTLREGGLDEIDVGPVVGPKALTLLNALSSRMKGPDGIKGQVEFTGMVAPGHLLKEKDIEVRDNQRHRWGPRVWSPKEIQDFDRSFLDLKLVEACLKYWPGEPLSNCGKMHFKIRVADGKRQIEWSR